MDEVIASALDSMRDQRLAGAIRRDFMPALAEEVRSRFADGLRSRLDEEGLQAVAEVEARYGSADVLMAKLASEGSPVVEQAFQTIGTLIGDFVRAHLAEVLDSMNRAGEGPRGDRDAVLARAREANATAEGLVGAIGEMPEETGAEAIEGMIRPAIDALDPVREDLQRVDADDALASLAEAAAPRPTEAADLLFRSWVCEADLLRAAADRVGRTPIEEGEAGFEQEQFLLDAIVALQEALQVRVDPAIALRLAKLRRAKGDVGDARGLCERIMDLEPEGENHEGAARLLEEIDENSLLGSGKKKRCFIATAAMGNPDAPEVEALRVIRDECLMESSIGRKMVEVYYRMSPPFADLIARNDVLRSLVRHGLIEPLAGMASAWMRVAGRHRARC